MESEYEEDKYYQNIELYYGDVAMPKGFEIDREQTYNYDILKSTN